MDYLGSPAELGGVITGLMLWAWALGRWQRGFAAAPAPAPAAAPGVDSYLREPYTPLGAAPDAAGQCQQAAHNDRLVSLKVGAWLGQIHADVSAYRRAAQVLTDLEAEEIALGWSTIRDEGAMSRYLVKSEKLTFPKARSVKAPCACSACNVGMPDLAIWFDQPSEGARVFTRV